MKCGAENMRFPRRITKARMERETLVIFNAYGFSTATVVTRTRFCVTLSINCLTWLIFPHFRLSITFLSLRVGNRVRGRLKAAEARGCNFCQDLVQRCRMILTLKTLGAGCRLRVLICLCQKCSAPGVTFRIMSTLECRRAFPFFKGNGTYRSWPAKKGKAIWLQAWTGL